MRFNGQNLERILSYIFWKDKGLEQIKDDLEEFDKNIVDKSFDSFCEMIDTGYIPTTTYKVEI